MTTPRLIIDFNRLFHPNPFNTGPPIPIATIIDDIPTTLNSPGPANYSNPETPELSSSPSSTVSSTLSLSLEDAEIMKIWDTKEKSVQCNDCLNPNALPFVPSFGVHVNFLNPTDMATYCVEPPPSALGFIPNVQQNTLPRFPISPSPGYHHELSYSVQTEKVEANTRYAQLFHEVFQRELSTQDRQKRVDSMVNIIREWNIDDLLGLAENIAAVACNPPSPPGVGGLPLAACDTSRYIPMENGLRNFWDNVNVTERHENIVASVAESFHIGFLRMNARLGQVFVWNLRETILSRFIHCWDKGKIESIKFTPKPTVSYVRSALALAKTITAMFKRNLIDRDHVNMCMSVLLKDLESIEHFEALSSLVLGCGQDFWGPSSEAITEIKLELIAASKENTERSQEKIRLSNHVTEFLAGLEANIVNKKLTDKKSVLKRPWGLGQLAWRVQLVVESVKLWEAVLMEKHTMNLND